ncbi:MAG TPA: hypothetical protein VEB19_12890 [Gemmatimonadaceae bacterium]|nr:hypothetical protein [Gemmatimonadaceae bacterium]
MEEALDAMCRFLHDELRDPAGQRACALVRAYKTHPYHQLDPRDREFARGLLGADKPTPSMRCLTLLATVGDEVRWNDRRRSQGHRAIPLPRADVIEQAPMIAKLLSEFGVDIQTVTAPESIVYDREGKTYGVFHVEEAAGSPYIPAQADFVLKYNIRSVVGCGGSLKGADLFAIILFSRVHITRDAAERFRTIALDVKSALFNYGEDDIFAKAGLEA